MYSDAISQDTVSPELTFGTVSGSLDKNLFVTLENGARVAAVRAASCLLVPVSGDKVLAVAQKDVCYILAVLARAEDVPAAIDLPPHSTLQAEDSALQIKAADLMLTATRSASLAADALTVDAHQGALRIGRLSLLGQTFTGCFKGLKLVSGNCEMLVGNLLQRLKQCFKFVEKHDEAQSATARQVVHGLKTVHSENEIHTAAENIKLDADQIHLG